MKQRYVYLDNLKWVLAVLVILHHAAAVAGLDPIGFNLPKVAADFQWQYKVLNSFQGNNQSFFMGTFFFISAIFVMPSYEHKGGKKFILDKLKRLGLPTLMWLVMILPFLGFLSGKNLAQQNFINLLHTGQLDLGVTWFCWSLIVFNVIWLITYQFRPTKSLIKLSPTQKKFPPPFYLLVFAIFMIPINLAGLYIQNQVGENFLGFHLLKYFPMYIAMFCLGIHTHQSNWLEKIQFKHAASGLLLWFFARAYLTPVFFGYDINGEVACRGFTVIGMTIFLVYTFKIIFDSKGKFLALLSRSAYAAYVFQIPFLYITRELYLPWLTPAPLFNFIVIAIPSVICSFAFGYLISKLPILNKIF